MHENALSRNTPKKHDIAKHSPLCIETSFLRFQKGSNRDFLNKFRVKNELYFDPFLGYFFLTFFVTYFWSNLMYFRWPFSMFFDECGHIKSSKKWAPNRKKKVSFYMFSQIGKHAFSLSFTAYSEGSHIDIHLNWSLKIIRNSSEKWHPNSRTKTWKWRWKTACFFGIKF